MTLATTIQSMALSANNQGIRILFEDGSRIVFRLSGTVQKAQRFVFI